MALRIHRLRLATLRGLDGDTWPVHGFVVTYPGGAVLVDTGVGGPQQWLADWRVVNRSVADALDELGMTPGDIGLVINTHLHFDHCGGNTRREKDKLVPVFPNARYVARKGEFEAANHPSERTRATYFPENYAVLDETHQLTLIERDTELVPGMELICVPGHTADMMCVKLSGGGKTAFFMADLVPTTAHLRLAWTMGYDLFPLTVIENKRKWIPQIARGEWIALFDHDADVRAAYLRERGDHYEAEPVEVP